MMPRSVYYIPSGTKNLRSLFPSIPWDEVEEFYIELTTSDTTQILATSPVSTIDGCEEQWRIHFLNYLGTMDALNFQKMDVEHDAKSGRYEKGIAIPFQRSAHAGGRFGVKSNDLMKGTLIVDESQAAYMEELFDSPIAWLEWTGIEGQADDYLPIVILDKKLIKLKQDDRFMYEINIEFTWSHDRIIIRN